jgi:hypothetical protein
MRRNDPRAHRVAQRVRRIRGEYGAEDGRHAAELGYLLRARLARPQVVLDR